MSTRVIIEAWVGAVIVFLLAVVVVNSQETKIRDRGVCNQKSEEVRRLCTQVQVQRAKISELEARLYGHIRAENKKDIEPRRRP